MPWPRTWSAATPLAAGGRRGLSHALTCARMRIVWGLAHQRPPRAGRAALTQENVSCTASLPGARLHPSLSSRPPLPLRTSPNSAALPRSRKGGTTAGGAAPEEKNKKKGAGCAALPWAAGGPDHGVVVGLLVANDGLPDVLSNPRGEFGIGGSRRPPRPSARILGAPPRPSNGRARCRG
jgi:hypothetical protein